MPIEAMTRRFSDIQADRVAVEKITINGEDVIVPVVSMMGAAPAGPGETALTDAQLRAAPVPMADAAATAKLEEHTTALNAINGKMPTIGQKTAAASSPVVLASNQPAITVAHAPVTRTPTLENATAAGTVAAGAVQVSILNTGTTAATVAGGQLLPGASITWAPPKGETLAAINYTATATSPLTISRLA